MCTYVLRTALWSIPYVYLDYAIIKHTNRWGKAFIMNETNRLVKGALLLTVAGVISKVLSAGYRVPLQNLTGDIGFYIYQQVYPLLGMATVLALYGFPSAISKMVVDLRHNGKTVSIRTFYIPLFTILFTIMGIFFLFIYTNADFLANLVGDNQLVHAYRTAAWIFLLIPFTALLRGAFQGYQEMKPTAYSQIGEQLIRVGIIIAVAAYVVIQEKDIYVIGQAAGISAIVGALGAIMILFYFFRKKKPETYGNNPIPWKYYIQTMIKFGVIASVTHMILLIIQFADTLTLVPNLMDYGLSKVEAMEAKGIFDRGQPLIQFGTVIGSSFALALLPAATKQQLKNDHVGNALAFSFYLSNGATLGLIMIFSKVNVLLFQDNSGAVSLRILGIAIVLSSIAITGSTILQGMGHIKQTGMFIVSTFFVKLVLNQWLVPVWGKAGSAWATIVSLFVLCTVVLVELRRKVPGLQLIGNIKWSAFWSASASMTIYLYLMNWLMPYTPASRIVLLFITLFIIFSGALVYMVMLIRLRVFSKAELSMLPLAHILIRFSKEE